MGGKIVAGRCPSSVQLTTACPGVCWSLYGVLDELWAAPLVLESVSQPGREAVSGQWCCTPNSTQ